MYKVYNRIIYSNAGLLLLASQTLDFADIWYSYLEQLENSAEGNAIILKFDDLVKNPAESVKSIYKRYDYQMNERIKKYYKNKTQ